MSSECGEDTTQIQEAITEDAQIKVNHWTNVMKKAGKEKSMGKTVNHFLCNYCPKDFQGPSSGTILKHLRKIHPKHCPELLVRQFSWLL
jgi:hypothetical protein